MIKENLVKVKAKIADAAKRSGRKPEDVTLICVTKEAISSDILNVISLGEKNLGENRVKDALLKHRAIGDTAVWHLIGHLQTNKTKDALGMFSLIHSLDSLKLAKVIDKEAGKINKVQDVLIEVNVSREATKFGIDPNGLGAMLDEVKELKNVSVKGLMTVTPLLDAPQDNRKYFAQLRELKDKFGLKVLSMGMSQDYEDAILEGATMVRVGRAIFGKGAVHAKKN